MLFADKDKSYYTHFSHVHETFARLNRVLMSSNLTNKVKEVKVMSCPFSDHNAIIMKVVTDSKKLPICYTIPSYMTKLKGFKVWFEAQMRECMDLNENIEVSFVILWDYFKVHMNNEIRKWCKNKVQQWDENIVTVKKKLDEEKLKLQNRDMACKSKINDLNKQYQEILNHKMELALEKIKLHSYASSPRAMHTLANRTKKLISSKHIKEIKI